MTPWPALLLLLLVGALAAPPTDTSKVISKFGFGSCNNQDEQQGIWKAVLAFKPDLWMWLGDIVYSDKKIVPFYRVPSPLSVMAQTYEKQKSGENYRAVLKSNPVIGIYDDHDYGVNNGGEEYNDKEEGRKLLLRFLDEPENSPRWQRKGAYTSYVLGPPGRSIKIIVLDTRYQRQFPSDLADMLGDEQWAWLEDQLRTTTSEINFILSSIQVLPHDKPFQEKWANFPRSRTRLLSLLMTGNVRNPIILSGDVHYGELFQFNCTDDKGKSRTLYEMTSSGMTHACAMQYPYGVCDLILQHIMKSKYSKAFYSHLNFGTVEIDWNAKPFVVTLQVRDFNGTVRVEQRVADEGKPVALQGTGDCLDDWKRLPVLVRWRLERWVFIGLVVVASGLIVVFGFGIALLSRPKVKKSTKSKTH